jgi:hypothetical protein
VQRRDYICSWITEGCEEIVVANIGVFLEVRFFTCLSLLYFEGLIGLIIYCNVFHDVVRFISYCSFDFVSSMILRACRMVVLGFWGGVGGGGGVWVAASFSTSR